MMATRKPKQTESTSRALAVWEQEMADAAVTQAKNEVVTGGYKAISFRGGILSVDDNAIEGNELNIVILASVHENAYYTGNYDPNNPASPVCYAFGQNDDEMSPHEASPDKQHDACSGCWASEFGTADVGRGKACKNIRRLVVITEEEAESVEALADAEPRMAKIPVMSVKNFSVYVQSVLAETIKRPCYGVVTTLRVVPDAKSQFRVQFKFDRVIDFDDALYAAMKQKVREAEANIANAYPVFEDEAKPQKGRGRTIPIKQAAPARGKLASPAKAPAKRSGKY